MGDEGGLGRAAGLGLGSGVMGGWGGGGVGLKWPLPGGSSSAQRMHPAQSAGSASTWAQAGQSDLRSSSSPQVPKGVCVLQNAEYQVSPDRLRGVGPGAQRAWGLAGSWLAR